MAEPNPLENLVTDGRLQIRPLDHYGLPDVITINLDRLANNISTRLVMIFSNSTKLRQQYGSSFVHALNQINHDTTAMVDYLVGQVYNRLRNILEAKYPNMRPTRMNTRCPIPSYMEFPQWIVSTLSCIGPCRVVDGVTDKMIVFATTQATMANYGRNNAVNFNEGNYTRLLNALKAIGVTTSSFPPIQTTVPSYYPFLRCEFEDELFSIFGTIHSSHFENEDVARILFVSSLQGSTPFDEIGMTIGYVNDAATLNALAVVAAPPNIPAQQDANSEGRPVAAHFHVNYYGIKPTVPAAGAVPEQARGAYIVGRGTIPYYQFQFAHNISSTEVQEIIRYKIMGSIYA